MKRLFFALVLSAAALPSNAAQNTCDSEPQCFFWNTEGAEGTNWLSPHAPFRIIGNLYYVGSSDIASYLLVTPKGNILINPGFDANVPMIRDSIEKLGFDYADTKILLISHAHSDHIAGAAQVIRQTGAEYAVMSPDVPVVESGGKADPNYGDKPGALYPSAHVDRVLHDGDKVKLGGTVLTALLTPGHTEGCTTWMFTVNEGAKSYRVIIVGSLSVNYGYNLVANEQYSLIADDYRSSFDKLRRLQPDVFLGAHMYSFNGEAKYARLNQGGPNPFIDPEGYEAYVAEGQAIFERVLKLQEGGIPAELP